MNAWLLRFVPVNGSIPLDLVFNSLDGARKARAVALSADDTVVLKSDTGVELAINPQHYTIVLTDAESSARSAAILDHANSDAARVYHLPMKSFDPGSSLQ